MVQYRTGGLAIGMLVPAEGRADGFPPLGALGLLFVVGMSIPVGVGVFTAAVLRRPLFVGIGLGGAIVALFVTPYGLALAHEDARAERVFEILALVPGLVVGAVVFGICAFVMCRSE